LNEEQKEDNGTGDLGRKLAMKGVKDKVNSQAEMLAEEE
jgi:hypothetical protein